MGCTATKETNKKTRENRLSLPDEHHHDQQKKRLLTPDQKAEEKKNKPPPLDKEKLQDLFKLDNQTIVRNKKFSNDYFITQETVQKQGQNGQFFVVEHKITGLKRIARISNNTLNEDQIQEYVNYLQKIKKIDHPNLIKLYDFYYDDKHIYLVEELCEGGDLFERLRIEMKSKEKVHVAFVFQEILSAISYLHDQDIIHKNIKTSNIVAAQKNKLLIKLVGYEDIYNLFQDKNVDISYQAPETFTPNYKWQKSADIWSAGVVLFELLFGTHPFKTNNKAETISNIKHKQDFNFNELQQDASQLLNEMLDRGHKQRPTAKDCLKYKFIKSIRRSSMKIASTLLKLKEFRKRNELKVILLSLMIEYLLPKEERDKIAEIFYKIDVNNNGKISKNELLQQYIKDQIEPNLAKKQVDQIFEQLDINGSQFLEFNEFIIASCNKETLLTQENLQIFFNKLDKDHSKEVSANELKVFFYNSKLSQQEWQQVLQLGDKDDNNKMSFKEFVQLLTENE